MLNSIFSEVDLSGIVKDERLHSDEGERDKKLEFYCLFLCLSFK
jgi:hypothetical protein